jgi:hypothetical protein
MTTHDQQTETTNSTGDVESSTASTDSPTSTQPPAEQAGSPTVSTHSPTGEARSPSAGTDSPAGESLFAEGELLGLRSRWDEVQSGFVDDPKECVQKADGLVSDVVDQLTTGFSEARSRLEAQWARGEEASTEDLRLALKRYREFFERLLAV